MDREQSIQRAALLVIDVQQAFDDPAWGPRNNPAAEANIARLLALWRAQGRAIVHVHHDSTEPQSGLRPGTPGNRPKPEALPRDAEAVCAQDASTAPSSAPISRAA